MRTTPLYVDLKQKKGIVPILINGAVITSDDARDVVRAVDRVFENQYHPSSLERFRQLERSQRSIIIDDLHRAPLTRAGQQHLLESFSQLAGLVIVFVDDLYLIDRLTERITAGSLPVDEFSTFEIREFGWRLRGRLISRWHRLGHELVGDEEDIEFRIAQTEDLVARLLGRNLLPSVPFTVLSILQISEATVTPVSTGGSYGYLYEVLITTSLSRLSTKNTAIDTRYAFLAHIAFAVFSSGRGSISETELNAACEKYFTSMRVRFSVPSEIADLSRARIIEQQGDSFLFKYRYVYCYFVARYFRDYGVSDPLVHGLLRDLVDRIYVDDYLNILTFYLYLTRDAVIIKYLLHSAKRIFAEHTPADLETDAAFINRLFKEMRPIELPAAASPEERRDEHRRRLDEREDLRLSEGTDLREVTYSDGLDDAMKLNFAFKTLHVMGQVLRNFPGSLPGEIKGSGSHPEHFLSIFASFGGRNEGRACTI